MARVRPSTMTIVFVVVALVGVGMLAVAPFILLALRGQTDDWDELGNIATTYGAPCGGWWGAGDPIRSE